MRRLLEIKDLYIKVVLTIIAACLIFTTFMETENDYDPVYVTTHWSDGPLEVYIKNRDIVDVNLKSVANKKLRYNTPILVEIEDEQTKYKRIESELKSNIF